MLDLLKDGIYSCGTLRSNRLGFPTQLKPHLKKGLPNRGDYMIQQFKKAKQIEVPNNASSLSISLWQDNKPVLVASTSCDPTRTATVQRRLKNGTQISVPCPIAIKEYNEHMGGVDLNDQLRRYYGVRSKGRKFYKYIWWFLFDVAVTNAFILCKHHTNQRYKILKDFRTELAKSLIGDFNGRKKRGRPSLAEPPTQRFCSDHFPTKRVKRSRCYYCYHQHNKRHDTDWYCTTCDRYLCHNGQSNDCYLLYHMDQ